MYELILSNFLIKMNTKSRTTSEVKFPLWKKNQHPLKKIKYLLLLDWKTLSFLNWTLSMSEYLAIKICQKFSQRETYQWPMAQLSVQGFLNLFHPVTYTVLTNYISYKANINYITISIT